MQRSLRFSALQRAENSSILAHPLTNIQPDNVSVLFSEPKIPQCARPPFWRMVMASFQCSSASRKFLNASGKRHTEPTPHEFQCSSASRKFLNLDRLPCAPWGIQVSVLFSEPKIPQYSGVRTSAVVLYVFQCSSASRKFLNTDNSCSAGSGNRVSVLFSEPKIPQ